MLKIMLIVLHGLSLAMLAFVIGTSYWGVFYTREIRMPVHANATSPGLSTVVTTWEALDVEAETTTANNRSVSLKSEPRESQREVIAEPVGCELPLGGFRGWSKGVVTTLTPEVPVNCSKVLSGDKEELERVKRAMSEWKNNISNLDMLKRVQNCSWLRDYFSNNLYNSKLEKDFPIAFTFVVYNSPQQVLRLLRLLYRPQNSYCIHCDAKSPYKLFFHRIARCFDNIIIPSKLERVVWGHYGILGAQMNCMTDLLHLRTAQRHKWRYLINLCGKELPLITNREIVRKLMKLNGTSSIIASKIDLKSKLHKRIRYPAKLNKDGTRLVINKRSKLPTPPFPLDLYSKSSSYNALSFQFSDFLAHDERAIKVHNFFKSCSHPEEHFYATLYHMPGVNGGYNKLIKRHYFIVETAFWAKPNNLGDIYHCQGEVIHDVCIIAAGDLKEASKRGRHLFHNKYFMDVDHTVMGCMEEKIVKLNMLEYEKECEKVNNAQH